jgi:hypothetical protein
MSAAFHEAFLSAAHHNTSDAAPLMKGGPARTVQLIAIGQGKPRFVRDFQETFKFHGRFFIDPTKKLYEVSA